MSLKAIIILPLVDRRSPPVGKFFRSEKHENHIWNGYEYDLENPEDVKKFNDDIALALAYFPQRSPRPLPRLIHEEIEPLVSHLQVPIAPIKKRGRPRKILQPA